TDGAPGLHSRERPRSLLLEPADDDDGERKVAAKAGPNRDTQVRDVEARQRADLAECDEADTEEDDADAQAEPRPELVDQPALHGAENAVLDLLHRERRAKRRLA